MTENGAENETENETGGIKSQLRVKALEKLFKLCRAPEVLLQVEQTQVNWAGNVRPTNLTIDTLYALAVLIPDSEQEHWRM